MGACADTSAGRRRQAGQRRRRGPHLRRRRPGHVLVERRRRPRLPRRRAAPRLLPLAHRREAPGSHLGHRGSRPAARRRDHDRIDPGVRPDVLVGGARARRARLRRDDLRRAGPGPVGDVRPRARRHLPDPRGRAVAAGGELRRRHDRRAAVLPLHARRTRTVRPAGATADVAAAQAASDGEQIDWVTPGWGALDRDRIGIAGHSLGASAVSAVQQCSDEARAVEDARAVRRALVPDPRRAWRGTRSAAAASRPSSRR